MVSCNEKAERAHGSQRRQRYGHLWLATTEATVVVAVAVRVFEVLEGGALISDIVLYYAPRNIPLRTRWTADGKQIAMSDDYKDGKVTLKPGLHLVIVEPEADAEYAAFPSEPAHIFSTFRHSWVLVRKRRPDVVVIEGLKMPRASRAAAENAKYCSLFFRPWTLLGGSPQVPHLSFLGLPDNILKQLYTKSDTPTVTDQVARLPDFVSWERSLDAYLRGNVVSEAVAPLIRSFCRYKIMEASLCIVPCWLQFPMSFSVLQFRVV